MYIIRGVGSLIVSGMKNGIDEWNSKSKRMESKFEFFTSAWPHNLQSYVNSMSVEALQSWKAVDLECLVNNLTDFCSSGHMLFKEDVGISLKVQTQGCQQIST